MMGSHDSTAKGALARTLSNVVAGTEFSKDAGLAWNEAMKNVLTEMIKGCRRSERSDLQP